jgi:aspartokinase
MTPGTDRRRAVGDVGRDQPPDRLAKEIMEQPDPRELDMIASTGEQVSVGLLSMALLAIGKKAVSYAGWQVAIKTDSSFTKARIQSIDDEKRQPTWTTARSSSSPVSRASTRAATFRPWVAAVRTPPQWRSPPR